MSADAATLEAVPRRAPWARVVFGVVLVYALFEVVARATGSERGQAGLIVAAVVVGSLIVLERVLFGVPWRRAPQLLGLGRPAAKGLALAAGIAALQLLVLPGSVALLGVTLGVWPGWETLLLGLFAQAGIAEETLFRGFLFRRFRAVHSFGRATLLASIPFVLVHLWMFTTVPFAVAALSVVLSAATSFSFAALFERAGGTIWGAALVHFVIQAVPKVVLADGNAPAFVLVWIVAGTLLPFLAFIGFRRHARPQTE
jgi:membrane protease YdiL (CAAX protease family)